jgi:hypothetical protein
LRDGGNKSHLIIGKVIKKKTLKYSLNPRVSDGGFALIVTISMMILLALLAVGLLSLSTVSLRSSTQGAARAVAQANARLALDLAVGDLQRELGPDSRISAPHDAGSASGGSKNWTAVYDAWENPSSGSPETPESRGEPKLRSWLASGSNEANGGPPGTTEEVRLLGEGSLGGSADPDLQVEVPMHRVDDSSSPGRIAWWIADEGTKAKINAGPNSTDDSSYGLSDSLFHSQSPPSLGHQMIPALAGFDWKDGQRGKVITNDTVSLATGVTTVELGPFAHDYTVYSTGVLADVRAGRLKRDLSNLLERPAGELVGMPLYLADGRMNAFAISEKGEVANDRIIPSSWKSAKDSRSQWGINLEELYLFHSLPRSLSWSGGSPSLSMMRNREQAVADRHFIYKRPAMQALQFILSLQAVPDSGQNQYKMVMKLDGMVAVSNPNDVPLEVPRGLALPFQLINIPYDLKWNIQQEGGGSLTVTSESGILDVFRGYLEGGTSGTTASGFTLEPGEAAVFGSSTASGVELNLRRGFVPSGGVLISTWDLKARRLKPTDTVDFEFQRIRSENQYGWTGYNTWIGPRKAGNGAKGWQTDVFEMEGGGLRGELIDQSLPPVIRPPQVRPVSDFIANPQPVLMLSFLQNVEQSSNGGTPDAFASRPFQLGESAVNGRRTNPTKLAEDLHDMQCLVTAEPMNYQFRTLAAGNGGRNIYIGGGRQPNIGGSFNVISRRIPLAPPLSIGAFQNAIASGFCGHFNDGGGGAVGGDAFPASAVALTGKPFATPLVSHAIGNSFGLPQLEPDEVFSNNASGSQFKVSTDQSWMVNTALWDSWFLSGVVDGSGSASSAWMMDDRSTRQQFLDFAEGEKPLRNKRFKFHASKSPDDVADELFTGSEFDDSAISLLSKYLLVDGSFNVNSTSENAWAALLASVRKQELIMATGSTRDFKYPFGTLGYAANDATSGNQGDWTGLRDLSEDGIKALAKAIVTEVKERGPFLSMADFVNRRVDSDEPKQQALGALQAAINLSGLNDSQVSGNRAASSADFKGLPGASLIDAEPSPSKAVGSRGFLTQGDLLTAIGSQISVRSDTFVIRAYGDARDAAGEVLARAWCEAVVQRFPEYMDDVDEPEAHEGWPRSSDKLAAVNEKFGRRFVVRSFRWLAPEEV